MPLPTLVKTWQHTVNQPSAAAGGGNADFQHLLRLIKNALIGFALGAWTVVGSSDGATAGLDAVDRWSADNKLVPNTEGNAHGWIVLKQTGIAANFQLLISCSSGTSSNALAYISPSAGFTGGSTTARPTATDETQVLGTAGGTAQWNGAAAAPFVFHAMQSTDGACTRVVVYATNVLGAIMLFEKPTNANAAWTVPGVAKFGAGSSAANYSSLSVATGAAIWGRGPSGGMNFGMTTEGCGSGGGPLIGMLQTTPNGLDGSYPMTSIGLYTTSVGMVGRHGSLVDLWFGSTTPNDADTYPNDATKQFVQVGDLVLPWNGSTPLTA